MWQLWLHSPPAALEVVMRRLERRFGVCMGEILFYCLTKELEEELTTTERELREEMEKKA